MLKQGPSNGSAVPKRGSPPSEEAERDARILRRLDMLADMHRDQANLILTLMEAIADLHAEIDALKGKS